MIRNYRQDVKKQTKMMDFGQQTQKDNEEGSKTSGNLSFHLQATNKEYYQVSMCI
jgi:hypothetical protein